MELLHVSCQCNAEDSVSWIDLRQIIIRLFKSNRLLIWKWLFHKECLYRLIQRMFQSTWIDRCLQLFRYRHKYTNPNFYFYARWRGGFLCKGFVATLWLGRTQNLITQFHSVRAYEDQLEKLVRSSLGPIFHVDQIDSSVSHHYRRSIGGVIPSLHFSLRSSELKSGPVTFM